MDDYTLIAFAVYPDGKYSEAFAEVSQDSLAACFAAMADEVADWLPRALRPEAESDAPQAIELTLEWSGAPAPATRTERPTPPGDAAQRRPRSRCGTLRCSAPRTIGPERPHARSVRLPACA